MGVIIEENGKEAANKELGSILMRMAINMKESGSMARKMDKASTFIKREGKCMKGLGRMALLINLARFIIIMAPLMKEIGKMDADMALASLKRERASILGIGRTTSWLKD